MTATTVAADRRRARLQRHVRDRALDRFLCLVPEFDRQLTLRDPLQPAAEIFLELIVARNRSRLFKAPGSVAGY